MVEPKGLVAAAENGVEEEELEERRGEGVRTLPTGLKSGIRSSGLFEAAGCKQAIARKRMKEREGDEEGEKKDRERMREETER